MRLVRVHRLRLRQMIGLLGLLARHLSSDRLRPHHSLSLRILLRAPLSCIAPSATATTLRLVILRRHYFRKLILHAILFFFRPRRVIVSPHKLEVVRLVLGDILHNSCLLCLPHRLLIHAGI